MNRDLMIKYECQLNDWLFIYRMLFTAACSLGGCIVGSIIAGQYRAIVPEFIPLTFLIGALYITRGKKNLILRELNSLQFVKNIFPTYWDSPPTDSKSSSKYSN